MTLFTGPMFGCAMSLKAIDIDHVQKNVEKGKTTKEDIGKMYGSPYEKGILKDGTGYFYYLYASPFGSSQDFTFYFDKESRVVSYASEYPGGNPMLKR